MKSKKIQLYIFVAILIGIAVFLYYGVSQKAVDEQQPPNDQQVEVNTSTWGSFVNDEFDFKLFYPVDNWNKEVAPQAEIEPKFNFYIKPQGVPTDTPFIHFANITNVSVFPRGVPTEGLLGYTRDPGSDWGSNIDKEKSRVYELESGEPFAAFIKFKNIPESWNEAGYVWVRLRADNFKSYCYKNGERVGLEEQCDPLGDESISIRHTGEVDETLWPVLKKVVKNFNFTE